MKTFCALGIALLFGFSASAQATLVIGEQYIGMEVFAGAGDMEGDCAAWSSVPTMTFSGSPEASGLYDLNGISTSASASGTFNSVWDEETLTLTLSASASLRARSDIPASGSSAYATSSMAFSMSLYEDPIYVEFTLLSADNHINTIYDDPTNSLYFAIQNGVSRDLDIVFSLTPGSTTVLLEPDRSYLFVAGLNPSIKVHSTEGEPVSAAADSSYSLQLRLIAVPEPSTSVLLIAGGAFAFILARRCFYKE